MRQDVIILLLSDNLYSFVDRFLLEEPHLFQGHLSIHSFIQEMALNIE